MLGIMSHRMNGAAFGQLSWAGYFGHIQLRWHLAPRCRTLMRVLDYGLGIFYPSSLSKLSHTAPSDLTTPCTHKYTSLKFSKPYPHRFQAKPLTVLLDGFIVTQSG
ncbi:hypothetical protein VC83_02681 [Pseudogymnoascus destructans]|uniref:Uncharacterized protein n=1 Tax=Pseudogymnoascus destructans TaxID=655981 RepID=A0A177AIA0_9PEZI|nr:uncharacterized protein VC83_02681 [Pseudogymnoascus destructans]OAF61182.1 hypothetical protein VC83_02681 [Pseudogymnoascus destructans]